MECSPAPKKIELLGGATPLQKRKKGYANKLIDQDKEGGRTERHNPVYHFFFR